MSMKARLNLIPIIASSGAAWLCLGLNTIFLFTKLNGSSCRLNASKKYVINDICPTTHRHLSCQYLRFLSHSFDFCARKPWRQISHQRKQNSVFAIGKHQLVEDLDGLVGYFDKSIISWSDLVTIHGLHDYGGWKSSHMLDYAPEMNQSRHTSLSNQPVHREYQGDLWAERVCWRVA